MIVGVLPAQQCRFPVLLCECGEVSWVGTIVPLLPRPTTAYASPAVCRACRKPFTSGRGSAARVAAAQAAVRLEFPDVVLMFKVADVRDPRVWRVTEAAFLMLSGGKPGGWRRDVARRRVRGGARP